MNRPAARTRPPTSETTGACTYQRSAVPTAHATAAATPRGFCRASASDPAARPSPTRTMPSSVARGGSGPSPSPLASATCAPFVAPVSATRNSDGNAMSASEPRASEHGRAQGDSSFGTEPPSHQRREERRREHGRGHHGEGRVGLTEEGLLERGRKRPDVGDEKKEADDREGNLADHWRGSLGATA